MWAPAATAAGQKGKRSYSPSTETLQGELREAASQVTPSQLSRQGSADSFIDQCDNVVEFFHAAKRFWSAITEITISVINRSVIIQYPRLRVQLTKESRNKPKGTFTSCHPHIIYQIVFWRMCNGLRTRKENQPGRNNKLIFALKSSGLSWLLESQAGLAHLQLS